MYIDFSSYGVYIYFIIKILLYVCVGLALYIAFWNNIVYVFRQLQHRSVFRGTNKGHSKLYIHMDKIYFTLYGSSNNNRVFNFFALTVILFIVSFMIIANQLNPMIALFISLMLASFPYLYLRLKLYKIRVESSYDADKVITEISNQYKICGFNMREAIRRAEKYLSSAPYCRKHIYSLALGLDTYKTDEELKKYLDYFVFSIDTQWAKMLSNNIFFAVTKNFDVAEGLSDILKDIKNSYIATENSKRENAESVVMVFYMAPLTLIASPFLAHSLLGFHMSTFFKYQFSTPIGVTLISLIAVTICLNYFVMYFLKRKKFDI